MGKKNFLAVLKIGVEDETEKKFQKLERRIKKLQRANTFHQRRNQYLSQKGNRFTDLGSARNLATAAVSSFATAHGSTVAATFEDSLLRTQALVEKSQDIETVARQLGGTTKFTATEVSNAMQELARAGLNANGEIQNVIGSVLTLGQATDTELSRSAEVLTDVMNQFSIPSHIPGNALKTADMLTYTANKSSQSFEELVEAIKPAGATAHALKMPIEQLLGTLAHMADKGIKGSVAGTAISGGLATLLGNPTPEVKRMFKRFGIRKKDFSDGAQVDFFKFLKILESKGVKERDFSTIFGKDNGKWLFSLMNSHQKILETSNRIQSESIGSSSKLAGAFDQSANAKLKGFYSAIDEFCIKAFKDTGFLNDFKEAVESITRKVQVFSNNTDPKQLRSVLNNTSKAFELGSIGILASWGIGKMGSLLSFLPGPWGATATAFNIWKNAGYIGSVGYMGHSAYSNYQKSKEAVEQVQLDKVRNLLESRHDKNKLQVTMDFRNIPKGVIPQIQAPKGMNLEKRMSFQLPEVNL